MQKGKEYIGIYSLYSLPFIQIMWGYTLSETPPFFVVLTPAQTRWNSLMRHPCAPAARLLFAPFGCPFAKARNRGASVSRRAFYFASRLIQYLSLIHI